jgi:hypothetical protein
MLVIQLHTIRVNSRRLASCPDESSSVTIQRLVDLSCAIRTLHFSQKAVSRVSGAVRITSPNETLQKKLALFTLLQAEMNQLRKENLQSQSGASFVVSHPSV